jgi:hypothetical protein
MKSHLVTGVITALVCFGIAAGVGLAKSSNSTYVVPVGAEIRIPSVDLDCFVLKGINAGFDPGSARIGCSRYSSEAHGVSSLEVGITNWHAWITRANGKSAAFMAGRTP